MTVQYDPEIMAVIEAIKKLHMKPADVLAITKTLADRLNDTQDTSAEATMWENETIGVLFEVADTIEFPDSLRRELLKHAQGPDWARFNLWQYTK